MNKSIQELIQKNKSEDYREKAVRYGTTNLQQIDAIEKAAFNLTKDLIDVVIEDEKKDWTIDTDDQNRNFISYKDGRRELIGDDWGIICFLHKKTKDTISKLKAIKELL